MRFITIFSALVLGGFVAANEHPLNPTGITLHPVRSEGQGRTETPRRMTNARRLARSLPPLKPHALYRGTRAASAPRSGTSSLPSTSVECNIFVSAQNGDPLGYLSRDWNDYGEYGILEDTPTNAAVVTFSFPSGTVNPSQLDILVENPSNSAFPYIGGVLGFSSGSGDFGPGSPNYAYIAGTKQTAPGPSTADSDNYMDSNTAYGLATGIPSNYESAIWSYNSATGAITARWTNSDGSGPATSLLLTNGVLLISGDGTATSETLAVDVTYVNFNCVPPTVGPLRK